MKTSPILYICIYRANAQTYIAYDVYKTLSVTL